MGPDYYRQCRNNTAEQPERRGILQVVGRRADISLESEWGEREPHTKIVAIGAPDSIDNGELTALFEACIAQ
ncbi:MAG: GTP-binding protein [Chloroflexi bacterium]|nr:GTP-binding protein [Chloroflexota bacterium]